MATPTEVMLPKISPVILYPVSTFPTQYLFQAQNLPTPGVEQLNILRLNESASISLPSITNQNPNGSDSTP